MVSDTAKKTMKIKAFSMRIHVIDEFSGDIGYRYNALVHIWVHPLDDDDRIYSKLSNLLAHDEELVSFCEVKQ